MPHKPPSQAQQIAACKRWNELHPIGTLVTVELDSGEIRATKTNSIAHMPEELCFGFTASATKIAVIGLERLSRCYPLSRVRAKGEAHHAG